MRVHKTTHEFRTVVELVRPARAHIRTPPHASTARSI